MPKVNISQAAKLAGLSRTQFYDGYVKKGIVSVDRSIPRRPKIDTAEIIRVFGTLHADNEKPDNAVHHLTDKKSTSYNVDLSENVKELTARIGQLETEKAVLDKEVELVRERNDELKSDRDAWRRQAETLLITQGQEQPSPVPQPAPSFWHWLSSWGRKTA